MRAGLPSDIFLSGLWIKIVHASIICLTRATCPPISIFMQVPLLCTACRSINWSARLRHDVPCNTFARSCTAASTCLASQISVTNQLKQVNTVAPHGTADDMRRRGERCEKSWTEKWHSTALSASRFENSSASEGVYNMLTARRLHFVVWGMGSCVTMSSQHTRWGTQGDHEKCQSACDSRPSPRSSRWYRGCLTATALQCSEYLRNYVMSVCL
jgi:hypothetical protein